jgi:hypothetical protein
MRALSGIQISGHGSMVACGLQSIHEAAVGLPPFPRASYCRWADSAAGTDGCFPGFRFL